MKNYFPCGKVKSCCEKHPVLTVMLVVLIVATIVFAIVAIVKLAQRENELLDEEWDLEDDDDEIYFYPNEEDFVEGE